jgi:dihydroflavonol-4-reductase
MKILVVGGTGLIGGHAALHLKGLGHQVAVAARKPAEPTSPMAALDFLHCDYVAGDVPAAELSRFDAMVFAAGNDVRHAPPEGDQEAHWRKANTEATPRFLARARDAGVGRAVLVGSFYPQVAPQLVETSGYVRSRDEADRRSRALAGEGFRVCSVNAPFVLGCVPGLSSPMFAAYTAYAQGRLEGVPAFAPPGGVNFISVQSLSEAIAGALERGRSGAAYLVGDENLTFQQYFGAFFRAAGRTEALPVLDREHPFLPDAALYAGRGTELFYEPDPAETALLGYRRGDVGRTVDEIVAQFRTRSFV